MKPSQTAHFHVIRSKDPSVARWALFALLLAYAPAFSQTTTWTDGTGNWFMPANWSAGVPNSSTIADINNGGTAQITSSGGAGMRSKRESTSSPIPCKETEIGGRLKGISPVCQDLLTDPYLLRGVYSDNFNLADQSLTR